MKLYVKYMVSQRCKNLVLHELEKIGIKYPKVDLGVIEISEKLTNAQYEELNLNLKKSGLELLDDKKSILVESIKVVIINMIHNDRLNEEVNQSNYIAEKLGYDYTYLSNIFSEVKGITIQQYIILHKIEKAKELLLYNELSLTEISYRLNYSSVSHLSNQFKKTTGLTPTFYKNLAHKRRKNLEDM